MDISRADWCKRQGNSYFREGNTSQALHYYTEAIVRVTQNCNPQESIYYSNRALVHFKLRDWGRTVWDCEAALRIDTRNIKAEILLGRAKASFGREICDLNLLKEAEIAINNAKKQAKSSKNAEFWSYCRELQWKIKSILIYQERLIELSEKESLLQYYKSLFPVNSEVISSLASLFQCESLCAEEEALFCPITLDILQTPVCTSAGHTYEREPLVLSFEKNGYIDPVTR